MRVSSSASSRGLVEGEPEVLVWHVGPEGLNAEASGAADVGEQVGAGGADGDGAVLNDQHVC